MQNKASFLYKGCQPPEYVKDKLKASGYEVKQLNLQELRGTPYNPFVYIRSDADIVRIADILANQIAAIHSGRRDTDIMVSLLSAMIAYLHNYGLENMQNMAMVMQMIHGAQISENHGGTNPVDNLFQQIQNKDVDFAYQQYENIRHVSEPMFVQTLAITADGLTAFNVKDIQELTNKDGMNMQNTEQRQKAIFLVPSDCQYFNVLNEILIYQADENGFAILP